MANETKERCVNCGMDRASTRAQPFCPRAVLTDAAHRFPATPQSPPAEAQSECWQCLQPESDSIHDPNAHDDCSPECTHHSYEYEPSSRTALLSYVGALLSQIANLRVGGTPVPSAEALTFDQWWRNCKRHFGPTDDPFQFAEVAASLAWRYRQDASRDIQRENAELRQRVEKLMRNYDSLLCVANVPAEEILQIRAEVGASERCVYCLRIDHKRSEDCARPSDSLYHRCTCEQKGHAPRGDCHPFTPETTLAAVKRWGNELLQPIADVLRPQDELRQVVRSARGQGGAVLGDSLLRKPEVIEVTEEDRRRPITNKSPRGGA